jgi:hypothetical protein
VPDVEATVFATDFHPTILKNLDFNVATNFSNGANRIIRTSHLDWSAFVPPGPSSELLGHLGSFDVIIGADIIYEVQHALWIKATLQHLLRRPVENNAGSESSDVPACHLLIPLRATHQNESRTVQQVFGLTLGENRIEESLDLRIVETEIMHLEDCHLTNRSYHKGVDYQYFKIAWVKTACP